MKVGEDGSEPVSISNKPCDVLHQHVSGSNCANDVSHPRPAPPLVRSAELLAGVTERLTGEASADNIDVGAGLAVPPGGGGSDVVMAGYLRPVSGQHTLAVGVEFDLPDRGHPGAF